MTTNDRNGRTASTGRRSDLRFAGMISAGMIATVLTIGALLAPLLAWNGESAHNARERSQTVRLSEPPAKAADPAATFAADRPGHSAEPLGRSIRAATGLDGSPRSAPAASPGLNRGLGVNVRP